MEFQPRNQPRFIIVSMNKKRYSDPKLHIPRVNGKPSIGKGKYWYVYFWWRTDPNGPLDKKFTFYKNINRLTTAKERRAAGNAIKKAYETALSRDWNPETKTVAKKPLNRDKEMTVEKALAYVLKIKKKHKSETTFAGYEFHLNRFLYWAKQRGFLGMKIKQFSIDHFYEFLDWIRFEYKNEATGKELSGTSINNHKRSMSAFFTTLKNERLINNNFIKGIPAVDQEPVNNKAFTLSEISEIKKRLEKEDPYLISFISFMIYPLLRPREICRLRVKDIDTEAGFLSVKTKTDILSNRRLIDKMKPIVQGLHLENHPGDYYLFSYLDKPKPWDAVKLKTRVDHFSERFRKIKNKMGYGREYSLYSFRHTAIMDLYNSLVKKGMGEQEILFKLMPITQHKSVAGIKNYLRNHKKSIPADHSDIYTIDF